MNNLKIILLLSLVWYQHAIAMENVKQEPDNKKDRAINETHTEDTRLKNKEVELQNKKNIVNQKIRKIERNFQEYTTIFITEENTNWQDDPYSQYYEQKCNNIVKELKEYLSSITHSTPAEQIKTEIKNIKKKYDRHDK